MTRSLTLRPSGAGGWPLFAASHTSRSGSWGLRRRERGPHPAPTQLGGSRSGLFLTAHHYLPHPPSNRLVPPYSSHPPPSSHNITPFTCTHTHTSTQRHNDTPTNLLFFTLQHISLCMHACIPVASSFAFTYSYYGHGLSAACSLSQTELLLFFSGTIVRFRLGYTHSFTPSSFSSHFKDILNDSVGSLGLGWLVGWLVG
jgi:hypothetical protein